MFQHTDLEQRFKKARADSVIHRARKADLFTFGTTILPYLFVAESGINRGDTILRRGEISTGKPTVVLHGEQPSFSGFGDEYTGSEAQLGLLFGRVFRFPNMRYAHSHSRLEVISQAMERVLNEQLENLEREGNTRTAVISGPEDCWALSLILYASEMTRRSAGGNIREMLEYNKLKPG